MIIFVLIALLFIYYLFSVTELKFYEELFSQTKKYETSYKRDSIIVYDSIVDLSGIMSDPYKFAYTINLGEYDSIYYFGEYPLLVQVKDNKPELYEAYRKYYNSIFVNINTLFALTDKHYYIVYALYKHGKVKFIKSLNTSNNLRVSPYFIMLRNKQEFLISGRNYEQKNKSVISYVTLEPIDSIYRIKTSEPIDSAAIK